MKNSELHQCGFSMLQPDLYGLYLLSDNSTIENNTFSNNYAGLVLESSNNKLMNNNFSNNDKYGILIAFCKNNTLINNTICDNKFDFGILSNEIYQNNNISLTNTVSNRPIYYLEGLTNYSLSNPSVAGFVGIVNCENISVSNQVLNKNLEGLLVLGVRNLTMTNLTVQDNNYGVILDKSSNIVVRNCTINNNTDIGFKLLGSSLSIYNASIQFNNLYDFELNSESYVQAINCTFNLSRVQAMDQNSRLELKNFLHIRTKNQYELPIGNVTIDIYDGNNKFIRNVTTNQSGCYNWIPLTGSAFERSGQTTSMRVHRLYVRFSNIDFNHYVTMNRSQFTTIYLNHAPVIETKPPALVFIDEESDFYFDFNYTDEDFDNVTWSYKTSANWLLPMNETSGEIRGTPTDYDVGQFWINISCDDDYGGVDFYNFSIRVNNTNDPPKIDKEQSVGIAFEDMLFSYDFNATDPDWADRQYWSMKTNADWLISINSYLGTIYGTPLQEHVGEFYVNVSCKDKAGIFDRFNFTIMVYPTNDPPEIVNPEDPIVWLLEESEYQYDFDYYDEDTDPNTWQIKTNGTWLEDIDSNTGSIYGVPHDTDVGIFFVNVSCHDLNDSFAYQNYSIIVINTNDPPTFKNLDNIPQVFYAPEDEYFECIFRISDPDQIDNFEFDLNLSVIESPNKDSNTENNNSNSWLNLDHSSKSRTCRIFGTPTNDDVRELYINLFS
jgi:parallel beta-helix repeat protein